MEDPSFSEQIKVVDTNKITIINNKQTKQKKTNRPAQLINLEDYNKNCSLRKTSKTFYYCSDIKKTLQHFNIEIKGLKKHMLEAKMKTLFERLNSYQKDLSAIVYIQRKIKNCLKQKKVKLYGEGFLNKSLCQNQEDFYTFEDYNVIDDNYFFSYKDSHDKIYYFDIRSFNKLIKKSKNTPVNPYNREIIPEHIITIANQRLKYMIDNKIAIDFEEETNIMTEEQLYFSRVLDIFQKIDELNVTAAGTNPDWFTQLNINKLKKFYRNLEDIWNYRANLTLHQKKQIVPNNDVFNISMNKIFISNNLKKVRNIILTDMDKLVSSGISDNHKTTGCYYILIALSEISPQCADALPWLAFM